MIPKNAIGHSALQASAIGFGTWGIGGKTPGATSYGSTSDESSLEALFAAHDSGVNFFDTAPAYGDGHSEVLLGKLVKARDRESIVIATKGGCESFREAPDFSPQSLLEGLEGSLKRLNSSHVDLYQLHNPPGSMLGNPDQFHSLSTLLADSGKIRSLGISVANPSDARLALEHLSIDSIQLNFNLLDQRAYELGLLDLAGERGISIIARTPLCFGFLTGSLKNDQIFSQDDHRSRWSADQINLWVDGSRTMISDLADRHNNTPSQIALRFCLSFPAITHAIPGMMTVAEVHENSQAGALGPLDKDDLDLIRTLYNTQEFFLPARPERPNVS